MTEFDAYKVLLEHVENDQNSQTLVCALNKLRTTKKCVDCRIYHGSALELRKKLRKAKREIYQLTKKLEKLMIPKPHRKMYTLPEVLDAEENTDVNDFADALNNQTFAPWRF